MVRKAGEQSLLRLRVDINKGPWASVCGTTYTINQIGVIQVAFQCLLHNRFTRMMGANFFSHMRKGHTS